jgi:peptidoglycan/LPS O-acetylase OafA/YrhL
MSGDLTNVDAPAWSLVYEMRISILFPLICWIVRRVGIGWILAGETLLALWVPHFQGPFPARLAATLNYSFYFFLGCWVAKNRGILVEKCSAIIPVGKAGLLFLALNLYVFPWEFPGLYDVLRTSNPDIHHSDLVTGLASCLLIVLALSSRRLQEWLGRKPLLWLGRVSYSFYLTHVVVLLSALYFLPASWSLLAREAIGGVACFFVAEMSYRSLELPFHNLGKDLARRLAGNRTARVARRVG